MQPKKGYPKQPSAAAAKPARKTMRALLPSGRVAEFELATVRDGMEITREAERLVAKDLGGGDEASARVSLVNGMMEAGLRRLLVGLSSLPVPPIYVRGFSVEGARAEVEQQLRHEAKVSRLTDPADVETFVAARLGAELAKRLDAAEDVDAMCRGARLEPISDLVWDEPAGTYLEAMLEAPFSSAEGDDWRALHQVALRALDGLPADPKARRRPVKFSES